MNVEKSQEHIAELLAFIEAFDAPCTLRAQADCSVSIHTWSVLQTLKGRLAGALRLDDARVHAELGYAVGALRSLEAATLRRAAHAANHYLGCGDADA
jgi:hypothetical protein